MMEKYCQMLTSCGGLVNCSVKSLCFYGYRPRSGQLTSGQNNVFLKAMQHFVYHNTDTHVLLHFNVDSSNHLSCSLHSHRLVFAFISSYSFFFIFYVKLHFNLLLVLFYFSFYFIILFLILSETFL